VVDLVGEGVKPAADISSVASDEALARLEAARARADVENARLMLEAAIGGSLQADAQPDRRLLQIEGTLAFVLTGVLASIAEPLANAEISIFAVSTYDTDYLLVSDKDLHRATQVLDAAGHSVRQSV